MNTRSATAGAWQRARGLTPAWLQRLLGMGLGGALGLLLSAGLWGEGLLAVWAWHQESAPQPAAPEVAVQVSALPLDSPQEVQALQGPRLDEGDAAWLWLQQRLQAHGLQVQALEPEALQSGQVLASQAARLRVLGAWADWLAFSALWVAHAPWWDWAQWQLQSAGPPGQVQIEGRLRLWLRPDRAQAKAQGWPAWPVVPSSAPGLAPLWALDGEAAAAPLAQSDAPPESNPDWRLWGVWTQAGESRIVLGQGSAWTMLAPGQSTARAPGSEAYRLERIAADGVHLRNTRSKAAVHLPWQGGTP